jgi:hypothetical protein
MCARSCQRGDGDSRKRRGVILLITLVILVILSTLGYTLSAQVAARRHRDRFIVDYAQARYACASAMKYALVSLDDLQPTLVRDPNQPDFSDVFAMTEPQYQALLAEVAPDWAGEDELRTEWDTNGKALWTDANDANDPYSVPVASMTIPGPYGPPWPLVTEPLEFEIGSAKVTIEIEDENAKYPLGWALIQDEKLKAEANAGFVTFCEWMGYLPDEIKDVQGDLSDVGKVRPFNIEFKAMSVAATPPPSLRNRVTRTRATTARSPTVRRTVRKTVTVTEQMDQQNAAFSRLFHSSLIDTDVFARPTIESDTRKESAMKYLGLWATRQVNINSAPRHVLEAALNFGSIADAPKIAEAIIQRRRIKPFSDIEELKKDIFRHGAAIEKCAPFITTSSAVFTVRVTAVSGVAKSVAIAGVSKDGRKVKRIAVISD